MIDNDLDVEWCHFKADHIFLLGEVNFPLSNFVRISFHVLRLPEAERKFRRSAAARPRDRFWLSFVSAANPNFFPRRLSRERSDKSLVETFFSFPISSSPPLPVERYLVFAD